MKKFLSCVILVFLFLHAVPAYALTSGATTTGSITYGGTQHQSFSGTAGQGILLFGHSSSFTVGITVNKPDGTMLGYGNSRYSVTLPSTGTYDVVISAAAPGGSGSYDLAFLEGGSSVSDGGLTSGSVGSASLAANNIVSYQFTGTSGQGVYLSTGATYSTTIMVYKPDGSYWTSANDRLSANSLPATGTYTVAVVAHYPDINNSGPFSMYYVIGGGNVSDGVLTSGHTYSGNLAKNAINSFQFDATAGQGAMIYFGATYANYIYLYKPDGSYLSYGRARLSVNSLPSTGTYTVVVVGYDATTGNMGPYDLYFFRGDSSVSSGGLQSGQPYYGSLAKNQIDSFTFDATAGQGVAMAFAGSYSNYIYVYKPDGSYLGYGHDRVNINSLPATGRYSVAVIGYDEATGNTGPYSWYYQRGADNVSNGTLVPSTTRSGTMHSNEIESYVVSGQMGNVLRVTTTGPAYYVTVYKPDGSYWGYGHNGFSGTMGASGNYTISMTGADNSSTGAYTAAQTGASAVVAATSADKDGQYCVTCNKTPSVKTGDPINFDLGYLTESATDYDAGGLTFSRIYRSDSTWTDNTVGELWRSNYARTLTVSGSAASITDGTGSVTTYTLSGSDWVPDDAATTATFKDDGSGGYIYTLPNDTVEKYNSSKQLVRIEYLGGGALSLAYNGSGQLTSVTNENGRSLSFTYSSGRIATMVTPDGTFGYAYDANGNLETVTKPDTKTIGYHYENTTYTHALTGITDESGTRYMTATYDTSGKATQSQLAGGVSNTDVNYNTGQTSTTTNALSQNSDFYYTNILDVRKIVQENAAATAHTAAASRYYNYDERGRLIGETDWENNTTRYEYDDRGNITKVTKAFGDPEQQITSTTYDSTYNLPTLVTQDGKTTGYAYDAYGRVTSMAVTDTNTSETRTTAYTYYANTTDPSGNTILGRLHTVDGPRTDVSDITTYTYDANLDLKTITNPLSQVTTIVTRDAAGRPTEITDANGTETDLTYDTMGRLHTSVAAVGTALAATTTYDYDDNGSLTKVTQPNGAYLQYSYDAAHRLTGIEDALGNTITYTLDNAGNITQEDIKDSSATLKYTHQKVFDALSRIIQSIGASSQTANYAYDKNSNLTTYTDPNNNATAYAYDSIQRLLTQTDALSGVATNGYDTLDDLTSVKDQRNNTTSYTYNAFGDVMTEASPDRGTLSFTVDKAGNVTQRTDARGVVTNYTYDALNRLTAVAYPSDSSLNVTLTYDAASGCGTAYKGHLCSVADAAGGTAYQYDVLGRVTQQTDTRNSHALTTAYTYDLAGNVLTVTLPSGRVITYTRNANGQVTGVSADVNSTATTLASSITYLPFGPMNALTYGNSLTLSATYNQDYNPTNRTISGGIANWTYTTDDNGNITEAGPTTYGYDALNRINAENPGTATSYTYDATTNRLTKDDGTTTTTTVPTTSNKISAVGAASYTYDDSGNITNDGTNAYTWNAAGNLATVNSTAGVYTYNWLNQRSEKVTASATTYYVYGPGGVLYGEYDSSGTFIREYVYLNGEPLAQVDAGSPEVLTYLHPDHLGTPRYATNTSGTQVWSWNNDAFGVSAPSGTVTVNLRMPGQYFDAESGLFYNWNRYYNPEIGRYISSDPIGIDGGLNTFSYTAQDPVNATDPMGQQTTAQALRNRAIARGAVSTASETGTWEAFVALCTANPIACPVGGLAGGLLVGYYGLDYIPGVQSGCDWWVEHDGLSGILNSAEHTKGKRPSTEGKHQRGKARKKKDYGGEKADQGRRPPRNPPPGWKGPWPPAGE